MRNTAAFQSVAFDFCGGYIFIERRASGLKGVEKRAMCRAIQAVFKVSSVRAGERFAIFCTPGHASRANSRKMAFQQLSPSPNYPLILHSLKDSQVMEE